jgi:hypothetical protein
MAIAVASGRFEYGVGRAEQVDRPGNMFSNIHRIFQISNQLKIVKYEKGTSRTPKFSKLRMVIDYFQMDNFHFWPNFQIPMDFEWSKTNESYLNFKGFQTYGKIP